MPGPPSGARRSRETLNRRTKNESETHPGPWHHVGGGIIEPEKACERIGEIDASVFGDTVEENQANTHLIAAAPEMLEALINAQSYIEQKIVTPNEITASIDHAIRKASKAGQKIRKELSQKEVYIS